MKRTPYIARPHSTAPQALTPEQVAAAYHFPKGFTGAGVVCGVVELGGGFEPNDLPDGLTVTAVSVGAGRNVPGKDAQGADGEVELDIEVAGRIAPGAAFRVYFAPNTDAGFLAAVTQACAECDVVSISWGGPETSWSAGTMDAFDRVFAKARSAGVSVFAASGDSGADDGTQAPVADFPASSPHVIACGGTRLTLAADGSRSAEIAWDDDDRSSASGGGVSRHFPGRQVPDVAGNADPESGYEVTIDGQQAVIGGTSAVAPLYAGLACLLAEAIGGRPADLLGALWSNPGVFFDVTVGDNGAYRAGPGRDEVTGLGVIDGAQLLAAIAGATPGHPPTPAGQVTFELSATDAAAVDAWEARPHAYHLASVAAAALRNAVRS